MKSQNQKIKKQYIEVPLPLTCNFYYKLWVLLKGILLSPLYLMMAYIAGTPGISFHLRCVATGARLLLTGSASLKAYYTFLCFPMDSTRYFEFYEVLKSVKGFTFTRYLDVSSPRLMPLFLLKTMPGASCELINPDSSDLKETEEYANFLGLKYRCKFSNDVLDNVRFEPNSFDLITCISVLEHIPKDQAAIEIMWSILRPGGKLLLTIPCMSQPLEQYINYNRYGVLTPGEDGYTYWQRYYDREKLESTVYSITGLPAHISVYGEKKNGLFFRNASMKRLLGPFYPFWREPYMMANEYQAFSSTEELPGEGVAIIEFNKPEVHQ